MLLADSDTVDVSVDVAVVDCVVLPECDADVDTELVADAEAVVLTELVAVDVPVSDAVLD